MLLLGSIGWHFVPISEPLPPEEGWTYIAGPISYSVTSTGLVMSLTIRNRIEDPALSAPTGVGLRFRLHGPTGAGQTTTIQAMAACKILRSSPDIPWDASSEKILTVEASSAIVLGQGQTVWTDPVDIDFDPDTEALVIGLFIASPGAHAFNASSPLGWTRSSSGPSDRHKDPSFIAPAFQGAAIVGAVQSQDTPPPPAVLEVSRQYAAFILGTDDGLGVNKQAVYIITQEPI